MGALRLVLALSVVATHASPILHLPLPTGLQAVRIFFIISGFYMALVLNEKYLGTGSYRIFLTSRFARIFPAYWLVAAVTLLCAWGIRTEITLLDGGALSSLSPGAIALTLISQTAIFGQDILALTSSDDHLNLVPQAWTLSIELMFYAIAPLIVRDVRRVAALFLISLAVRIGMNRLGYSSQAWEHHFFPSELAYFLVGALLYHAQGTSFFRTSAPRLAPLAPYLAGVGILAFRSAWAPIGYGLIALALPYLFQLSKRNAFDRLIGELSYPVYLVHWLIVFLLRALYPESIPSGHFGDLCTVLSLAASLGLYWLLIVPVDRWREERVAGARAVRPAPLGVAQEPPLAAG